MNVSGAQDSGRPQEGGDAVSKARRLFVAFERNKTREQTEAREARRYYNGRQWTDEEIAVLKRRKQPVVTDNRIARKVDFLVGVEQRMRRDPKAYPRGPEDQRIADTATAGVRFVCDVNRWEQKASSATHDAFVSGIGVVWVGVENGKQGPDPKLTLGQVDRFFYDPRSVMPDFSDAQYMGMHLWLDIEDAKGEYPQFAEQLDAMIDRTGGVSTTTLEEDRAESWGDFENRRVRVVEMYQRKFVPNISGHAWEFIKFSGSLEFEKMWSPYLDENGVPTCPYMAFSPYVDERGDRYGLVRNMRSMQDEINHRRSKLLHEVNVRQFHMRQGVVVDVDETKEEAAKPDGVITHNGTWGEDIGPIDRSKEIQGQAELLAQAQSSLENLGPNPGLIGKGGGIADQSGRAILAQRDSGMTELSPVFDRLRDWKLRTYRAIWARIKQSWTGERWIRITDDKDAPQFLGLNQPAQINPATGQTMKPHTFVGEIDVDIIMEEGPDTVIMQEELMQTLTQLGEAATGPLGKVLIELSNAPNKDKLLDMLDKASAPNPDVAALQKRMADLEGALKEAQVAKVHSDIESSRVDTAIKLTNALIPPQAIPAMYPIPFRDVANDMGPPPGQMPPQMPMGGPQPMPGAGQPGPDLSQLAPQPADPGALPVSPDPMGVSGVASPA